MSEPLKSKPWVVTKLGKAMEQLLEGQLTMEGIEYDESEWQDWQRELEKSAVHSALGSILLASENLLKARLHLSSAMWEASGWEEGE